jgi:hypothetical protein
MFSLRDLSLRQLLLLPLLGMWFAGLALLIEAVGLVKLSPDLTAVLTAATTAAASVGVNVDLSLTTTVAGFTIMPFALLPAVVKIIGIPVVVLSRSFVLNKLANAALLPSVFVAYFGTPHVAAVYAFAALLTTLLVLPLDAPPVAAKVASKRA